MGELHRARILIKTGEFFVYVVAQYTIKVSYATPSNIRTRYKTT